MTLRNIALVAEFDGTDFSGWQSQTNARNVQDTLIAAIAKVTGEKVTLTGCSRTDSGVHAKMHVSNFRTASSIPSERYAYAINSQLPPDVTIRTSCEVPESFNARFDSRGKHYRYLYQYARTPSAMYNRYAYFVRRRIDTDAMSEAAGMFCGTNDFSAFMAAGSTVKSTVRTLYTSEISFPGEGLLALDVSGDGFLYNMVRIIAGTVLEAGEGRFKPSDMPNIIASHDRRLSGRTLPPQGLMLCEVFYDKEIINTK